MALIDRPMRASQPASHWSTLYDCMCYSALVQYNVICVHGLHAAPVHYVIVVISSGGQFLESVNPENCPTRAFLTPYGIIRCLAKGQGEASNKIITGEIYQKTDVIMVI